jgi:hypothetical protein
VDCSYALELKIFTGAIIAVKTWTMTTSTKKTWTKKTWRIGFSLNPDLGMRSDNRFLMGGARM